MGKNIFFKNKHVVFAFGALLATTSIVPVVLAETAGDEPIEEIIVTGQKVERSLQDTPTSVAVINTTQLEERNISEYTDVLNETANAYSPPFGGFSIRGIDSFSVSGGGNSGLASVYIDGAAAPRGLIRQGLSTWDASQVEVFRGPQSTLQGRNSLAGAVVISTVKPTQEWEGNYWLQFGEYGQRKYSFAGGGGLTEELAIRASAERREFDGFNYNVTRNEDSDFRNDDLYRVKMLYTPKSMPDFSAMLSVTQSNTEYGQVAVNLPKSGDPFKQRIVTNNDPQTQEYETTLWGLNLDYDISDSLRLSSVTTYSDVEYGWGDYDGDNGPIDGASVDYNETVKTTSQEFRLNFESDRFTGVAGAYYFNREIRNRNIGVSFLSLASVGLSPTFLQARFGLSPQIAQFVVSQYARLDPAELERDAKASVNVKSYALFADATYNISEKLDVFGGIRWDREIQENQQSATAGLGNAQFIPDPKLYPSPLNQLIAGINAQLLSSLKDANAEIPLTDASYNEILPRLGVSYHLTEDVTTSFTVQQGYRSGGVGVNAAKGRVFQYDPEYTKNYELSLRSKWMGGKLTANANVFYIDWEDQQVRVQLSPNSFDTETKNAGSSTVSGFELEMNYQATDALTLYGSVGQAKTKFKEFTVVIPTRTQPVIYDLSGRAFRDTPEWTANLGATYSQGTGFFANVSINYASDSPAEVNPFRRGLRPGDAGFDLTNDVRTLVNAQIGYEWDNLGIYLVAKNVLDEEYIASANFGTGRRVTRHTLGKPRQLGISIRGRF